MYFRLFRLDVFAPYFFLFFIEGSSCLLCLNSLGKLLALSLPNLSPLMDVECSFLMKDYR